MKYIYHLIVTILLVFVIGCTGSKKEFATYEVNPLKSAFAENRVTSYVEYGIIDGELFYGDSISFDRYGNIISKKSKGGWGGISNYLYDTLNRLIMETQQSDIAIKVLIDYKVDQDERTVTKYIKSGGIRDSLTEITYTEILNYDRNLANITSSTEVSFYGDTIVTLYTYLDERIVKEETKINGRIFGVITEYKYDNGKLIQVKRTFPPNSQEYEIDYISEKNGLIDSTLLFGNKDVSVKRYKYYYSKDQ